MEGEGRAGDAFRNGNGTHLFIIYSLTLNGNPMGPIKALPSPNSHLKSAGAGPVLWRQKYLKVERRALLPPPRPSPCLPARPPALSTFERLFTVPKITGAASLSRLWGRMAGGLAFEVEEGLGGVWEWTIAYSGHKIGQERGPGDGGESSFQFSSREKRVHERQNNFPVCRP